MDVVKKAGEGLATERGVFDEVQAALLNSECDHEWLEEQPKRHRCEKCGCKKTICEPGPVSRASQHYMRFKAPSFKGGALEAEATSNALGAATDETRRKAVEFLHRKGREVG